MAVEKLKRMSENNQQNFSRPQESKVKQVEASSSDHQLRHELVGIEDGGRRPSKISEYFGRKALDSKLSGQASKEVGLGHNTHSPVPSDRFQATGNFPGSELIYLDDVGQDGSLRRTYYKSVDQLNEALRSRPSNTQAPAQFETEQDVSSNIPKGQLSRVSRKPEAQTSKGGSVIPANDPRIEDAMLDETSLLSNIEMVRHKSGGERSAGAIDARKGSYVKHRQSYLKENSHPSPQVAQHLNFEKFSPSAARTKSKQLTRSPSEKPGYFSADSREIREALRREASETTDVIDASSGGGRTVHGYTEIKQRMMNEFGDELVLSENTSNQKQKQKLRANQSIKPVRQINPNSPEHEVITTFDPSRGTLLLSRSTQTDTGPANSHLLSSSLCYGCLNAHSLQPLQLSFGTVGNGENTNSKESARQERLKFGYEMMSYQPSHKLAEEFQQLQKEGNLRHINAIREGQYGGQSTEIEVNTHMSSGSKGGIRIYDPFVQKRSIIRQKMANSGTGKKSHLLSSAKGDCQSKSTLGLISATFKAASPEDQYAKPKPSPPKVNQKSYLSNFESKLSFYENSDIKYFSLERKRSRERFADEETERMQRPTAGVTVRSQLSGSKSTGQLAAHAGRQVAVDSFNPERIDPENEKIRRIFEADGAARVYRANLGSKGVQLEPKEQYYLKDGLGGVSRKLSSEFVGNQKQNRASNEAGNAQRYQKRNSQIENGPSLQRIKVKEDISGRNRSIPRAEAMADRNQAKGDSSINISKRSASKMEISQSFLNNSKSSHSRSRQPGVSASSVDKWKQPGGTKSTAVTSKLKELSSMARNPENASQSVNISPFDPVNSSTRVLGPPSKKSQGAGSQNIQIPISLNINLGNGGLLQEQKEALQRNFRGFELHSQLQGDGGDRGLFGGRGGGRKETEGEILQEFGEHSDSLALFEHELSLTLRRGDEMAETKPAAKISKAVGAKSDSNVLPVQRKSLFDGLGTDH